MSLAISHPLRAFALIGALAALAAPAAAESVKVDVSGVDAKTAHVRIVKAAESVCGAVLADEPLRLFVFNSCVNETVAATEAKFAANERHLASLQTTGH
jgi:UrcA family protein